MKIPTSNWFEQYDCDDDRIQYQFMDITITDIEYEPDFSEYLWMEDMEEFDKNVRKRWNYCLEKMIYQIDSFRKCKDCKMKKS